MGLGAVAALQFVPSVVSLGQWLPVRSTPGGWCRWRGPARPQVALTFDDGPDPDTTPVVLDRLDELGLRATFFCLGQRVERHPEVIAEVLRRGHQVELHGHGHGHHLAHGPRWVAADLDAALGAFAGCGLRPRWFRPPYGQISGPTLAAARRRGLEVVLWSAWGREWASTSSDEVAARVVAALAQGAIVLLHDSDVCSPPGSAAHAIDALGPIAAELDSRGLEAVRLDDLVAA
jgi:peptidoglycan/xylan/chitin deacetylase (PgdA/CDA1 family)